MTDEPDWRNSDRTEHLSESEQHIRHLRRGGEDFFDRQGRPRVALGKGPESEIVRATHGVRARRPWRESDAISEADFRRMYEAVAVANLNGWLLNSFVTIAWAVGGVIHPSLIHACHKRFQENAAAWFRYQREEIGLDTPFAGIWVMGVGKTLGLHSHFLFHVPDDRKHAFRDWARKAAHRIVEAKFSYQTVKRPDGLRLIHVAPHFSMGSRSDNADHQWRVFKYMMKALDPDEVTSTLSNMPHVKHLLAEFVRVKTKPQGIISGARVGRTTDLGPLAMQRTLSELGHIEIWPSTALCDDELRYSDCFLNNGEFTRHLKALW